MAENGDLSGDRFCGILLGAGCGAWEELNQWTVQIPEGKPPVVTPVLPQVEESNTPARDGPR